MQSIIKEIFDDVQPHSGKIIEQIQGKLKEHIDKKGNINKNISHINKQITKSEKNYESELAGLDNKRRKREQSVEAKYPIISTLAPELRKQKDEYMKEDISNYDSEHNDVRIWYDKEYQCLKSRKENEIWNLQQQLNKLNREKTNIEHLNQECNKWYLNKLDINHLFTTSDFKWYTLLHFAAVCGCLNIVKDLIAAGAKVDQKSNRGDMPLHLAASSGHLSVVQYLIEEAKADINKQNDNGNTPLNCAFYNGCTKIVKYLIEKHPPFEASIKHLVDNEVKSKRYSLSRIYGDPLHLAATYNCMKAVKSLLDRGENPLSKNDNGDTPRSLATDEKIKHLLEIAEIKQQKHDATKWGVISFCSAASLGSAIAITLFATAVITTELLPILATIAIVAISASTVGELHILR